MNRIINIYRTWFDYCFVTGTGETPAQRLRLADRFFTPLDVPWVEAMHKITIPRAA